MGIIDSIMTLEVKETCWAAHGADWSYEWDSFAAVINGTCCTGLDCEIGLLSVYHLTWFLWIWVPVVLFANFEEVSLSRWARILAPQSLQIDSTDIAAPRPTWEGSIDLFKVIGCEYSIVLVTANVITKIFFAYLCGVVDRKGITIVDIG